LQRSPGDLLSDGGISGRAAHGGDGARVWRRRGASSGLGFGRRGGAVRGGGAI
jgi:hypothetical protein